VVVVGGGDTAMEEAHYLAGLCKSRHADPPPRRVPRLEVDAERVVSNPKIKILYSHVVDEVLGVEEDKVTGVRVKNLKTGESNDRPGRGALRRHRPHADDGPLQGSGPARDAPANGYLKTVPGSTRTSVEGVFAAGDVQDWTYRQAVTAAGSGRLHGGARRRALARGELHAMWPPRRAPADRLFAR
jgi:thioredoxin reductase (NADPH)